MEVAEPGLLAAESRDARLRCAVSEDVAHGLIQSTPQLLRSRTQVVCGDGHGPQQSHKALRSLMDGPGRRPARGHTRAACSVRYHDTTTLQLAVGTCYRAGRDVELVGEASHRGQAVSPAQ